MALFALAVLQFPKKNNSYSGFKISYNSPVIYLWNDKRYWGDLGAIFFENLLVSNAMNQFPQNHPLLPEFDRMDIVPLRMKYFKSEAIKWVLTILIRKRFVVLSLECAKVWFALNVEKSSFRKNGSLHMALFARKTAELQKVLKKSLDYECNDEIVKQQLFKIRKQKVKFDFLNFFCLETHWCLARPYYLNVLGLLALSPPILGRMCGSPHLFFSGAPVPLPADWDSRTASRSHFPPSLPLWHCVIWGVNSTGWPRRELWVARISSVPASIYLLLFRRYRCCCFLISSFWTPV